MRANGLEHAVSSGGTGTLTLAAVTGKPSYAHAFGSSGVRIVEYQVLDAAGVPLEGGLGSIDLSTMVLTRTRVDWTWNGTTYSDVAPDPTDVATSATVICGPTAEGGSPFSLPFHDGSKGDGFGVVPPYGVNKDAGTPPSFNIGSQPSAIGYFALPWPFVGPVSEVTFHLSGARTSASASDIEFAVYSIGADGLPHRRLAYASDGGVNNMMATTGAKTIAFPSPVRLPPGMYIGAWRQSFTGGSNTPQWQAMQALGGGPFGTGMGAAGNRNKSIVILYKNFATLDDPADTSGLTAHAEGNVMLVALK